MTGRDGPPTEPEPLVHAGFPKSGNMLVHLILRELLAAAGRPHRSVLAEDPEWRRRRGEHLYNSDLQPTIDVLEVLEVEANGGDSPPRYAYSVSSFYRREIPALEDYLAGCSLVWTHEPNSAALGRAFARARAVYYIYRDARSVLLSQAHYWTTRYVRANFGGKESVEAFFADRALCRKILGRWRRNVESYLGSEPVANLLVLRYEELIGDKALSVRHMAEHAGLASRIDLDRILERTSPEAMRPRMPEHVRTCRPDEWRDRLPPAIHELCRREVGSTLEALGYGD